MDEPSAFDSAASSNISTAAYAAIIAITIRMFLFLLLILLTFLLV